MILVRRPAASLGLALAVYGLAASAAVAAGDALAGITPLPSFERVALAAAPKAVADFELTDQNGRAFRFSSLQGQPALVFFGFAHCPDVCPATLQKLTLLTAAPERHLGGIPVVMISVDGDRDTPELLKQYLGNFSRDYIGLTGDPRKIRDIAAQFPAVFFKGLPMDASGRYVVQHSSQVYAVDKSGRLRAEFHDASLEAMQGVMQILLKE